MRICQYQKERGNFVQKNGLTAFGRAIKKRLVDIDHSQAWLIEQVAGLTGLYFDRSYMAKIQTGKLSTPRIVQAICEILNLPEQAQDVG